MYNTPAVAVNTVQRPTTRNHILFRSEHCNKRFAGRLAASAGIHADLHVTYYQ